MSDQMSSLRQLKKDNNNKTTKEISVIAESQLPLKKKIWKDKLSILDVNILTTKSLKILDQALTLKEKVLTPFWTSHSKEIGEVVVTHKDRLCRFGFELVLRIIESTNGKILVLNKQETSPEKELVNDILSIITVFSSRLYGLRSNSIKNKIRKVSTSTSENIENSTIS
jgi:predicted site-specific integrase-resolvase